MFLCGNLVGQGYECISRVFEFKDIPHVAREKKFKLRCLERTARSCGDNL